jgi:hypothetical protein
VGLGAGSQLKSQGKWLGVGGTFLWDFTYLCWNLTNKREEGIFIREWNRALERLRDMDKATARFIHPLIVDDTAEGAVTFSGFREFHYARAAGGEPQEDFIKTLTAIVRERRLKAASQ